MRALRSGLLLCLVAALTLGGEWLAGRGQGLVSRVVPSSLASNAGGLWFYSVLIVELALVSISAPRALRTPWWPEAWDRWAVVGLCAAALTGPLGYALFRWEPRH